MSVLSSKPAIGKYSSLEKMHWTENKMRITLNVHWVLGHYFDSNFTLMEVWEGNEVQGKMISHIMRFWFLCYWKWLCFMLAVRLRYFLGISVDLRERENKLEKHQNNWIAFCPDGVSDLKFMIQEGYLNRYWYATCLLPLSVLPQVCFSVPCYSFSEAHPVMIFTSIHFSLNLWPSLYSAQGELRAVVDPPQGYSFSAP